MTDSQSSGSTQSDPSDIRAICTGANATEIVDYICQHCGENVKAALGDYEEGCLGSGMDICTFTLDSPPFGLGRTGQEVG